MAGSVSGFPSHLPNLSHIQQLPLPHQSLHRAEHLVTGPHWQTVLRRVCSFFLFLKPYNSHLLVCVRFNCCLGHRAGPATPIATLSTWTTCVFSTRACRSERQLTLRAAATLGRWIHRAPSCLQHLGITQTAHFGSTAFMTRS